MEEKLRLLLTPRKVRYPLAGAMAVTTVLVGLLNPGYLAKLEQPGVLVVVATLGLTGLFAYGLSAQFGGVRRRKLEAMAVEARAAIHAQNQRIERENERIRQYRAYPLTDYTLCSTCGWIGVFESKAPTYAGTKAVGTVAAVGGTGFALAGCGGSALGIILILVGVVLLPFFCVGLIPIIIGIVLMVAGGTATTVGATAASTGASAVARASHQAQAAARAPHQCPQCRNTGLIPAMSPVAINQIQNNPHLVQLADAEANKVLDGLPQFLEPLPYPALGCGQTASSPAPQPIRGGLHAILSLVLTSWTLVGLVPVVLKAQRLQQAALPPVSPAPSVPIESLAPSRPAPGTPRLARPKTRRDMKVAGAPDQPNSKTKGNPGKAEDPFKIRD